MEEHHIPIKNEHSIPEYPPNSQSELLSKLSAMSPSTSNGHFHHQLSPPQSSTSSLLSPSNLSMGPGADEGGRHSTSPNNHNMIGIPGIHACSHCPASFPTRDLLEKHEVMHSQNATVVSTQFMNQPYIQLFLVVNEVLKKSFFSKHKKFHCMMKTR